MEKLVSQAEVQFLPGALPGLVPWRCQGIKGLQRHSQKEATALCGDSTTNASARDHGSQYLCGDEEEAGFRRVLSHMGCPYYLGLSSHAIVAHEAWLADPTA